MTSQLSNRDAPTTYTPRTEANTEELTRWRQQRAEIGERVAELIEQGTCYQCRELASGDVLGTQHLIAEDADVRIVLALDPRVPGHTIVVWKPHVHDFTELDDDATSRLFTACRDMARALRTALTGIERVYQVTMCDGAVNHLHIQLIPRYAGTPIGSHRLVDTRGPVLDGQELAAAVTAVHRP